MKNLKDLTEEILTTPIEDVIEVTLENRPERENMVNDPRDERFLCPFHDDHSGGHFKTYIDKQGKGRYKCFVCDAGPGGTIDFVKAINNESFKEAVYDTAVSLSLITKQEYKKLTKKDFVNAQILLKSTPITQRIETPTRQDEKITNLVYNILSQGEALVSGNKKLSREDCDYLHSRGIENREIVHYGYFTIHGKDILPKLLEKLAKYGYDENILVGIPGFYRDKTTGRMSIVDMEGIGIPIRNELGMIHAIQVRAREKDAKPRYKFLSSSFVTKSKFKDICCDGCGPEHTLSVVQPIDKYMSTKYLCITEGQFKATQFAKETGCVALSVQGVNNTKDVIPTLNALDKLYKGFKNDVKIVLAFDMDMNKNVHVFKAAHKLAQSLLNDGWKVSYMSWSTEYKGLDDYLIAKRKNSNLKSQLWSVSAFERNVFVGMLNTVLKERDLTVKFINDDKFLVYNIEKTYQKTFVVKQEDYVGFIKKVIKKE